jgi:DNA-directed RNA polymerase specialized sigma subunit
MTRRGKAREKKILANLGLVDCLIRAKYPGLPSDAVEDYRQAGLVGLIQAVDHYDPKLMSAALFSTYARTCILSEMRFYESRSSPSLLPQDVIFQRRKIEKLHALESNRLDRPATSDEVRSAWTTKSKKPTDAAIERALAPIPSVYVGQYETTGDEPDMESRIDAKRELGAYTDADVEELIRRRRTG